LNQSSGDQRKHYVLDTNVLLHSPLALQSFQENHLVLPIDVIEELDRFKGRSDELGRNAREVIRKLDALREHGSLTEGVPLNEDGGTLRIDLKHTPLNEHGLSSDSADHRIVSVAYRLEREGHRAVFVTKDMNLRIKSDALGVETQDFLRHKVRVDTLSPGWRELLVENSFIDQLYRNKSGVLPQADLPPNEGLLLRSIQTERTTALAVHRQDGEVDLVTRGNEACFGIRAHNLEQRLALDFLLDPSISLVCLIGKAGTGKTLLALVAGLQLLLNEQRFETLLVSRPIMPLGRDLGFLPGKVSEKLEPWMKPIFDNLQFALKHRGRNPTDAKQRVDELMSSGLIEMEALTYIRGRSIHNQFLIIDECQNLTPHEVKTVISRAGHDTKVVLTGDPYQIDNPYLDSESNGLTYVAERMGNESVAAHVCLSRTERSELASLAADVL
jgi:PhoH-like ATPase